MVEAPRCARYLYGTRISQIAVPGRFLLLFLLSLPLLASDAIADATAALQQGDFRSAASFAEAGLQRSPSDLPLLNLLGIARSELGDTRSAQTAFERGLKIAPTSVSLNENLGLLFFKRGLYGPAKQHLSRAVAAGSSNPGVRYSLAAAYLRTGEAERARSDLQALEPALANVPDYWEERGRAELPVDPKIAETSFLRAAALAPDSTAAFNGAASAAEAQGLDEKALAYLIDFRKRQPNDIPTALHFASLCVRRDLGPDAIEALNKVRALQPNNQTALFLLARANISVANWDAARRLFLEFLRINRRYAPALYAVAWVDLQLNRRDEARRYLDLALAAQPRYSDALCERAQMEADDRRTAEAERDLTAALAVDPHSARANLLGGDLRSHAGDLASARAHYERALASDPNSSAAHYKLATVLNRLGDKRRAGEERSRAAALAEQNKKESKTQLRLVLPAEETK